MASVSTQISEQAVKDALKGPSWALLDAHLSGKTLAAGDVVALCQYIRHFSDLIYKYPNKTREKKRDRLFAGMRARIAQDLDEEAAQQLDVEIDLIGLVEHGYRRIIETLESAAISQRAPATRVAACLSRGGNNYLDMLRQQETELKERKTLTIPADMKIPSADGSSYAADSILHALNGLTTNTLIMEAHRNSWFENDIVRVPALAPVSDTERDEAMANEVLALCWRAWDDVQKRRRYLGGDFAVYGKESGVAEWSPEIDCLIKYSPPENGHAEREIYDYIANTRLRDWMIQTFADMEIDKAGNDACGIECPSELPPANRISLDEAHADVALCELLSYDITKDHARPGGLRLLEWVRGYAVLKELVAARVKIAKTGDDLLLILDETELFANLERCGLSSGAAIQFVENVSLRRNARDMFDCPVVRLRENKVLIFGPTVADLNIAVTVLSNLTNLEADLSQKGHAFEDATIEFLRDRGHSPVAFEFWRDGAQYEYDVVLPWQGKLFIFECKNRSLSGHDPAAVYYFDREVQSQAKQVRRLADALQRWPDEVAKHIGPEFVGHEIVPVILHSLPYARCDDIDGVFFTDASSLHRFFKEAHFRFKIPYKIGNMTLLHRVALRAQWSGDAPSADDLERHMRSPYQLELSCKHLDLQPRTFPLSQNEQVQTVDLSRDEMTLESTCEALGIDIASVHKIIADVRASVAEVQAGLDARGAEEAARIRSQASRDSGS